MGSIVLTWIYFASDFLNISVFSGVLVYIENFLKVVNVTLIKPFGLHKINQNTYNCIKIIIFGLINYVYLCE